ncbi:hypothetical protein Cob_v003216 [Colletotrichum orbiculare MAFF 240422]|uniref:Uncharacterized protein n=1 Tax=Colletotrichum orbiculare (strain 104-T / ATCC 96160 / CBS 514.97 / LARS 414 / MAFF 240422) TaxID=1213857 RepID=A0A484G1Z9_COLOR|nr:hypothetical protein Cob_v003216 [Colletotrichum orbiculare MAFF 240422]
MSTKRKYNQKPQQLAGPEERGPGAHCMVWWAMHDHVLMSEVLYHPINWSASFESLRYLLGLAATFITALPVAGLMTTKAHTWYVRYCVLAHRALLRMYTFTGR